MKQQIKLTVNGESYTFEVKPWETLLEVLRDNLKLTRTKEGCSVGECGSCAVLMNKKLVNSCLILALDADGKEIITTEKFRREGELNLVSATLLDNLNYSENFESSNTSSRKEFYTFCHICSGHCSIKVIVEEGKVVDIAPDLESGLPSELCPTKKSRLSIPEIINHPDRLKYPMKRVGQRGDNKWERISWDQALDTIGNKLTQFKQLYGPESIAFGLGEPKGMEFAFAQRLATVFGSPNVITPGWCCGVPVGQASVFTCGWNTVPDETNLPRLMVHWGINNNHTSGGMRRESFANALENGSKLIVVDPRKIDNASLSDIWIRPRPSSDGALAMGLLKVIAEEHLYDKDIVANFTVGFDKLEDELKGFTLNDVEKITWVPVQQIQEFARLYASIKPASIQTGNALDNSPTSFQTGRAVTILRGITGNLNVPGGDVFLTPAPFTRLGKFFLLGKNPRREDIPAGSEFPLAIKSAFIPPHSFVKAVLDERPYPIKAALFLLTNPLLSYPNSNNTYQALMKLDFIVVSEIFMSSTAKLADIVLPAAWGMEHEEVGYWPGWYEEIRAYPKIVDPPGECWPDTKWINELAKRLGLAEYFWETDEDALDYMLAPSGLTYKDFKKIRVLHPTKEYKQYNFRTPSNKIEVYSEQSAKLGISPIPTWDELRDLPVLNKEYPLLMTNAKESAYMLTGYKNIPSLHNVKPEPMAEMHTETAEEIGLHDGDLICIETNQGKITQKLALNDYIQQNIVSLSFGWDKSNINMLIGSDGPYDRAFGSSYLRGIPCRVYNFIE